MHSTTTLFSRWFVFYGFLGIQKMRFALNDLSRIRQLVRQALFDVADMPRMQKVPQAKKAVSFLESGNNGHFSMPSVNQIASSEWSNGNGNGIAQKPYVIGVVGGTNSGKTSVCKKIISEVSAGVINVHFWEAKVFIRNF